MTGNKIRKLRQSRGLSLAQLAALTQTTAGYLSQLERGLTDPSLSTLRKIAAVLAVPLFSLIDERDPDSCMVRAGKRQKMTFPDSSVIHELLTPASAGQESGSDLLMLLTRLAPRSFSNDERVAHNAQEWILVLQGSLEVLAGEKTYILREGDSIYLKENIPHNIYNPGSEEACVLSAMTPAVFVSSVHA